MTRQNLGAGEGVSQPQGNSHKWTVIEKLLAVAAAIFALATAWLGFQTAQLSNERERANTEAQSSGAEVLALEAQVRQLEAENQQLREGSSSASDPGNNPTPDASGGTAGPNTDPILGASPIARHQGTIVLRSAHVDLDAPASDSQWSEVSGGRVEMWRGEHGDLLQIFNGSTWLPLGPEPANYATCSTQSGYTNTDVEEGQVQEGEYICVKTSERRFAAIRLLEIGLDHVKLDVTTFDPPAAS
jgi:hypothetical protein